MGARGSGPSIERRRRGKSGRESIVAADVEATRVVTRRRAARRLTGAAGAAAVLTADQAIRAAQSIALEAARLTDGAVVVALRRVDAAAQIVEDLERAARARRRQALRRARHATHRRTAHVLPGAAGRAARGLGHRDGIGAGALVHAPLAVDEDPVRSAVAHGHADQALRGE